MEIISSQMSSLTKDVLDVEINLKNYMFTSSCEKITFDGYMIVYNVNKSIKNNSLNLLKKLILELLIFLLNKIYHS